MAPQPLCSMTTTTNWTSCPCFSLPPTGLTDDVAKAVMRYLDGETNNDMRKNLVERLNARGVVIGHKG